MEAAEFVRDRTEMINFISEAYKSEKAIEILHDALDTEALRLTYSLNLAKKRLKKFEKNIAYLRRNSSENGMPKI